MAKELTILDGTKEEGINSTKELFGLSSEQSFQDLDVDEEVERKKHKGEPDMEQLMIQNVKNDLIYYGVYSASEDMWNGSDVLCAARKLFFETGMKQKKRSSIRSDNIVYNYSYTLEQGVSLKYKKMKGGRQTERVVELPEGYCVELTNELHRPVRRAYYDRQHFWLRTEYLNAEDRSVETMIAPAENTDRPAVSFRSPAGEVVLYPFAVSLDRELTQKLNVLTSEPRVFCVTSCGSFYFCTEDEYEQRMEALKRLIGEEKPAERQTAERTVESEFVVDTSLLEKEGDAVFDLRSSREVRLSEQENEPVMSEAVRTENQPQQTAAEEALSITDAAAAKSEESEPTAAQTEENAEESGENKENEDAQKTARRTITAKAEDKPASDADKPKRSRRKKTETEQPAEKTGRKKTKSSSDEAAEPVEPSIFGYEKGDVPPTRERGCAFALECPYEAADKQIIESGGVQYYYFGEIADDRRSGRGRTVMKNGGTAYEGGYLDDKREGFGVYYYKSGKLCYAGNWKQNKREGLGAAFSPADGSVFVGKWSDDVSEGVGSHYDSEGRLLYTGAVENGKRSGAGVTFNEEDGTFFIGKYKDGAFLETGTQFSSEGDLLYTGGYKNNMRSGEGTAYLPDGSIRYKGGWFNNKYDGEGKLYNEDGSVIEGSFKNGSAHGKCTLTSPEGRIIYVGGYIDGSYNGAGRLFLDDGGYADGRFVDGEPTGIFSIYDKDKQLVYCGEWEGRTRNGRGTEYVNGEKLYEGEFRDSQYNGEGKLFSAGEAVYTGSFRNGKKEGYGAEYSGNGLVYKGMWRDDAYNGCGVLYKDGEAVFAGQFADGKMNGRINEISGRSIIRKSLYKSGELTYTCEYTQDGSLAYYGNISGGMRNGMGCTFIANAEKQFEGIFKNNEPEKPMRVLLKELSELPACPELENTEYELYRRTPEYIIEKNITIGEVSAIYSGRLRNGLPDGSGTILYSDHRYTGYFIDGKPEGEGVVYNRDGEECRGIFSSKPFSDCKTMILADITYFYKETV